MGKPLGVLIVSLVIGTAGLSGCVGADAEVNGDVGISVDSNGHPIVVIAICKDFVDQVSVTLGREGLKESEANPAVGVFKAGEDIKESAALDLSDPGSSWSNHEPVALDPTKHYIAIAEQAKADVEAAQVDFFGRDLAKMKPGFVYTNTDDIDKVEFDEHKAADFQAFACP